MGIRYWNVYRRGGANARIGDTVHYRDRLFKVVGTMGSDSEGVPYVRLQPVDPPDDDHSEVVCLVTQLKRVV
jgi:hypothetical protein